MDAGKLVPDEVIIDMIEGRLSQAGAAHGAIPTGFRARSHRPRRWMRC